MEKRSLEITLASAKGLKDVNIFTKMAVYAVVTVSCNTRERQRTPSDREGGRNPSWNTTFRLSVPADLGCHTLHILLRAERVLGDRDVGVVRVPLSELLVGADVGPRPVQFVSYQVLRTGSGKPKGVLNFSYRLGERVVEPSAPPAACCAQTAAYHAPPAIYPPQGPAYQYAYGAPPGWKLDEPVMAYPVGPSSAVAYPAYCEPPLHVFPQPPPYGYRYPPGGYGYGAAPPAVTRPPPRNSTLGLEWARGYSAVRSVGFLLRT